ncbi:MAG: hypothetical protein ACRDDX_11250 [Cellulosilyticaceae bacterium]
MKRNENGSILVLVIIIFTVILLIGTMLITKAQVSHKYAIRETQYQQANYVAKSVVDAVKSDIMNHPSEMPEVRLGEWVSKTNTEQGRIEFIDEVGQKWEGTVKVEDNQPNLGQFLISAEVQGTNNANTINSQLKGIVQKGIGSIHRAFEGDNSIIINSSEPVEINKEILSTARDIVIEGKDSIKVKDVTAFGRIDIKVNGSSPKIQVKDLWSYYVIGPPMGGTDITIDAGPNGVVEVNSIEAPNGKISIKAKELIVNSHMKASGMIELKVDTIKSGSNGVAEIEGSPIKYTKYDGNPYNGPKYKEGITKGLKNYVPTIGRPTNPTSSEVGGRSIETILSEGDITIYQDVDDKLYVQYVEETPLAGVGWWTWKEQELTADKAYVLGTKEVNSKILIGVKRTGATNGQTGISATHPAYRIEGSPVCNPVTNQVNMDPITGKAILNAGVVNIDPTVLGIDGASKEYMLFTDVNNLPYNIEIINNNNIGYIGSLQTSQGGEGGLKIYGTSLGLSLGARGYEFKEYTK